MPEISKETKSIRRLRRVGTILFLGIAGLLVAHLALLEVIHGKQRNAAALGALAAEQRAALTQVGRDAQGILLMRENRIVSPTLMASDRTNILSRITEVERRDRQIDALLAALEGPVASTDMLTERSHAYRSVVEAFLRRAVELADDDPGPTGRTWTLPDLAIAPHGVLMSTLADIEETTRVLAEHWRVVDFELSIVSIGVVALLSAILVFGFFHPLTRRALTDFLELQDSLSVRTRYFYQMSHELRTPLNVINGYSELMTQKAAAAGDRETLGYCETVLEAGRRLTRRVGDILTLAELQAGTYRNAPGRVDPLDVVNAVAGDRPAGLQPVEIQDLRLHPAPVEVDPIALATVLDQLVRNAVRHARERCILRLLDTTGGTIVEVADDGAGIDRATLDRLSLPFHTTANAVFVTDTGPGVGLAIVKQLTALNGITTEVLAQDPSGTVFRLTLPAARNPAPLETRSTGPGLSGPAPGTRCVS